MSDHEETARENARLKAEVERLKWADERRRQLTHEKASFACEIEVLNGRLSSLRTRLVEAEREVGKWLAWSNGQQPDDSTGDVIAAYDDGTIILDDSITTWNPLRALKFMRSARDAAEAEHDRYAAEARGVIMGLERARMILASRVFADGEKSCNCDVEMRDRLDAEIAKAGKEK